MVQTIGNMFMPSGGDNANEAFLVLHVDRFITYLISDVLFCFIWVYFRRNGDVYSFYSQQEHANFSIFQACDLKSSTVLTLSSSIQLTGEMIDELSNDRSLKQRLDENNSIQMRF